MLDSPPLLIPLINIRTMMRWDFSWPWIKTSASIPPRLLDPQLKWPKTKINIIILSVSHLSVFHTKSKMPELKSSKHSTLTASKLGPLVLESSNKISKFCATNYSEYKFHKAGIENWLRIESAAWESPKLETCSWTNNGSSLKILYTHP